MLLSDWTQRRGGRLVAGIVDHGLRAESGTEAAQVAGWLAALGIEARILPLGMTPGAGAQARAREARLDALAGLAAGIGAPWVALGQHRQELGLARRRPCARAGGAAAVACSSKA